MRDGFDPWNATRRRLAVRIVWPHDTSQPALALTREQFDTLVLGLPWRRPGDTRVITRT